MHIRCAPLVLIFSVVFFPITQKAFAVSKVSRTMNVIEFFGGSAMPHGKYGGILDITFVDQNNPIKIDAEDFLDNSFFVGFNYGVLLRGHSLVQLGFRYTNHNVDTTVINFGVDYSYYQTDLDMNYKLYFVDLNKSSFSPFIGAGVQSGFTTLNLNGIDTERDLDIVLSLDFGGDLKLWSSADGRGYLTLSSTNDYNFTSSNNRPKYLDLGVGLKYYFRP